MPDLAPGASAVVTITVDIPTLAGSTIHNAATVSHLDTHDPNSANDTDTSDTTVVPGADDHLVFDGQPSDVTAGEAINPAVAVGIYDQFGNLTHSTASVDLAVTGGTPTLFGTTSVAASDGTATFTDLSDPADRHLHPRRHERLAHRCHQHELHGEPGGARPLRVRHDRRPDGR